MSFQTAIISEPDLAGFLLTMPFIALLVNLMKLSLHTSFNPKLELNFDKLKAEAEVEETKREFISLAAHQLRTPLGAMRWNLEALLANKQAHLEAAAKQTITEVYSNTLRMITLVSDLLDINKLLRGQASTAKVQINIDEVIKNLVKDTEYLTHKDAITITYSSYPVPPVSLDPKSLHEVLLNIVTNAIKYSKPGGTVAVKAEVIKADIVISIADHGIGISAEDSPKIFSKFFRAANAAGAVTEGSGLGLYLVKLLVTNWGGRVWYDSQLNQGTTFFFTIPLDA